MKETEIEGKRDRDGMVEKRKEKRKEENDSMGERRRKKRTLKASRRPWPGSGSVLAAMWSKAATMTEMLSDDLRLSTSRTFERI